MAQFPSILRDIFSDSDDDFKVLTNVVIKVRNWRAEDELGAIAVLFQAILLSIVVDPKVTKDNMKTIFLKIPSILTNCFDK